MSCIFLSFLESSCVLATGWITLILRYSSVSLVSAPPVDLAPLHLSPGFLPDQYPPLAHRDPTISSSGAHREGYLVYLISWGLLCLRSLTWCRLRIQPIRDSSGTHSRSPKAYFRSLDCWIRCWKGSEGSSLCVGVVEVPFGRL